MLRSLGLAGMMTLVLLTAPARAFDILDPDYGGRVEPYAARLAIAEARREPIRIGPTECNSSCTLYLASRRSCVSAELGLWLPRALVWQSRRWSRGSADDGSVRSFLQARAASDIPRACAEHRLRRAWADAENYRAAARSAWLPPLLLKRGIKERQRARRPGPATARFRARTSSCCG